MPRPLTDEEVLVINRVLTLNPGPAADAALAQLRSAMWNGPSHEGGDACFDIIMDGETPLIELSGEHRPAFEALVYNSGTVSGEVSLWVTAGRLSGLEFSWCTKNPPNAPPSPERLGQYIEYIPPQNREQSTFQLVLIIVATLIGGGLVILTLMLALIPRLGV